MREEGGGREERGRKGEGGGVREIETEGERVAQEQGEHSGDWDRAGTRGKQERCPDHRLQGGTHSCVLVSA